MRAVIGALRANLGLDSAQFERGARRSQSASNKLRATLMKMGAAAAAAGAALTAIAMRGAADIDRLVKGARRIDGTTTALQALELAASEAGVSMSALTNDLQTMNRELASSSTGAQRAMQRLNMSANDLMAMDADERVAAIADRVQELGLSAGEATALLRDLGIRNREMALLMIQGGDAIRRARDDVRDYGLEIDDAMGARIEQARDQIGRLGIVTQYFGQRLAADVVPALGMFAQAITDSMREGGTLRAVIDGLVNNMQLLATIAGVAVVAFGTRYVAALVAARVATLTLSGALVALRTALIRTGIGALIVGAGVLVDFLIRLRQATGSWGEALSALGDLAAGVWQGITTSAEAIPLALGAVWDRVVAGFQRALATMSRQWAEFVGTIASSLTAIPGFGVAARDLLNMSGISAAGLANRMDRRALMADWRADTGERLAGDRMVRGFDKAREALSRLNETLADNGDLTTETADASRELAAELNAIADAAGGGGGGGGRGGQGLIPTLEEARSQIEQLGQTIQSSMEQGFMAIVDGTKSARDAFRDMARQILSELFRVLVVQRLVGAFGQGGQAGTGILGAIGGAFGIGANANGTTNWRGGLTMVGERGPELVNLPRGSQVIDAQTTASRMGGGDVVQHFNFNLAANGDESVRRIVAQAAPQIVEAAKSGVLDARRRGGSYRAAFG